MTSNEERAIFHQREVAYHAGEAQFALLALLKADRVIHSDGARHHQWMAARHYQTAWEFLANCLMRDPIL